MVSREMLTTHRKAFSELLSSMCCIIEVFHYLYLAPTLPPSPNIPIYLNKFYYEEKRTKHLQIKNSDINNQGMVPKYPHHQCSTAYLYSSFNTHAW